MWIKIGINFFNLDKVKEIVIGTVNVFVDKQAILLTEEEIKELEAQLVEKLLK